MHYANVQCSLDRAWCQTSHLLHHHREHLMAYVFISAFSKVISAVVAPDKVSIDNWSFKLYYRITPMILGVSTVLVCCRQV